MNLERYSQDWLIVYVVYDHPFDYPDQFVVRQHWFDQTGTPHASEHLEASSKDISPIRAHLYAKGLMNVGRFDEDDPKVLEVWV